ncbi:hypothetical protein Val02_64360 [Virgisporangium aliadipatigenens]|uniref:Uncharacterized protein n=1 Tax=Virgisporangium aliadipatigenens TaxID=741659 RepID=A0A8J3YTE5_9ACTN|nr:hypothetical protein Val02_64360 [Virgisporangium aliadipatigenens]
MTYCPVSGAAGEVAGKPKRMTPPISSRQATTIDRLRRVANTHVLLRACETSPVGRDTPLRTGPRFGSQQFGKKTGPDVNW